MDGTAQRSFGSLLRQYRTAAGLTQEELAERADLSVRAVMYLERGERSPYPTTIRRLVDALGVTIAQRTALMEEAHRREGVQTQPPRRSAGCPRLDPRMIRRTDAVARLLTVCDGRLATVVAGPGWGKTTTLTQLAEASPIPVAWCRLRSTDADVAAFALRLIEAISEVCPGFGAGLAARLGQPASPAAHLDAIVGAISAEAAGLAGPCVLLLDDYHLVIEDDSVNRLLGALLEVLPAGIHLVVASRRELPPFLARIRAASSVCHLDEDDLRLGDEEGTAYLETLIGSSVERSRLGRFVCDLDGWPLGLTLLGERLRKDPSLERLPGSFPGLFDYFRAEVMQHEAPEIQELLIAAAIPERFDHRLLRQMLGWEAADRLDELPRRHLYVSRLGGEGEWYRFHPLFRAFLQSLVERGIAGAHRQRLELRAADAWHSLGQAQEAVQHELSAAEYDRAAQTIRGLAPALMAAGQSSTLHGWLARMPHSTLARHPDLLVYLSRCLFIDRRTEECWGYTLLLCAPDHQATWDDIAAMLWPGLSPEDGRRRLRHALQHVTHLLAPEREPRQIGGDGSRAALPQETETWSATVA